MCGEDSCVALPLPPPEHENGLHAGLELLGARLPPASESLADARQLELQLLLAYLLLDWKL